MASADVEYRCFVGGLAWATDSGFLEQAFGAFGEVVDSKIINDRETGRSMGFGFVTFRTEQAMKDAIEGMNGQNLDGRDITVNEAQSRGGGYGGYGGYGGGYFGGGRGRGRGGYGGYGGGRRDGGGGVGYGSWWRVTLGMLAGMVAGMLAGDRGDFGGYGGGSRDRGYGGGSRYRGYGGGSGGGGWRN